jgi:DNA-directed RNA polymerase III subunit RPC8
VFKPFIGEVITGRVTHISKEGMKISIEFFDDISISGAQLQHPSDYNAVKNQWTWTYDDGENQTPFVTEVGDEIRFKVRSVSFTSVTQTVKGVTATTTSESSAAETGQGHLVRRRSSSIGLGSEQDAPAAMQITGSTNDFGLGVTSWW